MSVHAVGSPKHEYWLQMGQLQFDYATGHGLKPDMQLEISLEGAAVVLLGEAEASRQAVLRYRRAGATLAHFDSPAAFMAAVAVPSRPGRFSFSAPGADAHQIEADHTGGFVPVSATITVSPSN